MGGKRGDSWEVHRPLARYKEMRASKKSGMRQSRKGGLITKVVLCLQIHIMAIVETQTMSLCAWTFTDICTHISNTSCIQAKMEKNG